MIDFRIYVGGWFTIYLNSQIEDSLKVDILNLAGNFSIHKQIEKRNGLTFMRIKKRKIL